MPYVALPPGHVRPTGWLAEQISRAARGITGSLPGLWPDVGADSGWLGGEGEHWERGPYYVRGLLATAHVLGDARLRAQADPWIEWTLASQQPNGFFGPAQDADWWPRMPMLEALEIHHDATGDPRIVPFLQRYFRHQLATLPTRPLEGWAVPRGGDNIERALRLHARTAEPFLLDLVDMLAAQTTDWLAEFGAATPSEGFERAHGVNRAMGLRLPLVLYLRTGDPRLLACWRNGWEQTLRGHGQIHGVYSCDELLHGRDPRQGTELCTVVEVLSMLTTALGVTGDPSVGDAIERIAYNALPATLAPDLCTHQYFQQVNQIACTPGAHRFWYHHDTDLLFGVAPGYGCCAANMHLGWPRVAQHLFYATREGGIAALVLGPGRATVTIDGHPVEVVSVTDYPFDELVRLEVRTGRPTRFPLGIRVPGWATGARVQVGGEKPWQGRGPTVVSIERIWRDGDVLTLELPMPVRVLPVDVGVAVERGPLVFALPVPDRWVPVGGTAPFSDFEVRATGPWNFGLVPARVAAEARVERAAAPAQPWTVADAPIRILTPGHRVRGWAPEGDDTGPLPPPGSAAEGLPERLTLVPYGAARLRVAVFPSLG